MKLLKSIWRFFFPIAKEVARDIVYYKARDFTRKKIWQNRSFRKRQLIGKRLGAWRVTELISSKQTKKSNKARNQFTYKLESWQTVRISA